MRIVFQYLSYLARARHRKGHGIHSPFVFDFVSNVLYGNDTHSYSAIEERRRDLLRDRTRIYAGDYGAGSRAVAGTEREVRQIVKSSAIRPKYGRLLTRMISWYAPDSIIELGTGSGISSAYLASGHKGSTLYTIEGSKSIQDIARETMIAAGLNNVELIRGLFADKLPLLQDQIGNKNKLLVFIDGDHTGKSVLENCGHLLKSPFEDLIIILDDINWSPSMTAAWKELIFRDEIAVSIDLFQFGFLFVKKGIAKQYYMIRF